MCVFNVCRPLPYSKQRGETPRGHQPRVGMLHHCPLHTSEQRYSLVLRLSFLRISNLGVSVMRHTGIQRTVPANGKQDIFEGISREILSRSSRPQVWFAPPIVVVCHEKVRLPLALRSGGPPCFSALIVIAPPGRAPVHSSTYERKAVAQR